MNLAKKFMALLALAVFLLISVVAAIDHHAPTDNQSLPGLPPGYHLEVNNNGEYRPVMSENNAPLFWLKDSGSREEAIARAWTQYEYDQELDNITWEKEEANEPIVR